MSQRERGPNNPDALTPGILDDVRRNLEALYASISQLAWGMSSLRPPHRA